jgi:hypothetical protein
MHALGRREHRPLRPRPAEALLLMVTVTLPSAAWATGIAGTARAALAVPRVLNSDLRRPKSLNPGLRRRKHIGQKPCLVEMGLNSRGCDWHLHTWNTCPPTCGASKKRGSPAANFTSAAPPRRQGAHVQGPTVRKAHGRCHREVAEGGGRDLGSQRSSGFRPRPLVGSMPTHPKCCPRFLEGLVGVVSPKAPSAIRAVPLVPNSGN